MDRYDFYKDQQVTEAELDGAFDAAERADRAMVDDYDLTGIMAGLSVVENSPTPNLSVLVDVGTAYDPSGRRLRVPAIQTVSLAADSGNVSTAVASSGNEKIVGLYLKSKRLTSDPRTDGDGNPVQFVQAESFEFIIAQGAESLSPTPPAQPADTIRIAYVTRTFGQTQILNANIDLDAREMAIAAAAGALELKAGTIPEAFEEMLTTLDDHINGSVGVHPASAIAYAGGPTWADASANPAATVEAQLDKIVTDLKSTTFGSSGANKTGIAARTAWLDTTANAGGNLYSAVEKIITDLVATAGAARIGAAATAQSPTSLSSGSVKSQLDALLTAVNARARIGSNELITGNWSIDGDFNFNQVARFLGITRWKVGSLASMSTNQSIDAHEYDEFRLGTVTSGGLLFTLNEPVEDDILFRLSKPVADVNGVDVMDAQSSSLLIRMEANFRGSVDLVSSAGRWKVSSVSNWHGTYSNVNNTL